MRGDRDTIREQRIGGVLSRLGDLQRQVKHLEDLVEAQGRELAVLREQLLGEREKICHIVGPHDPDMALSGKDVTGYSWNPPWPMCVVSVDLYEQGRGRR